MAGTISDLINNIKGSVEKLVSDLSGAQQSGVPTIPRGSDYTQIQSSLDQSSWMKLSFPYTFSIIDISDNKVSGEFGEFKLPIAPQSIRQTENFAVSIKPTQGGTTVTHSGNRYKLLNIKGTTGLQPFRGTGGVEIKSGEAILQPSDLKYRSGYEVFIRLRNWFRTYYEYKKVQGNKASNLRLVFKNYKDGEFLIVELLKFDMSRQASRSFLYDYDLDFKVLAHMSYAVKDSEFEADRLLDQAVNLIDRARGTFLRTQGILRQIESVYGDVVLDTLRRSSLAVKAFKGITPLAADIQSRTIKSTVSRSNTLAIALGIKDQQEVNKVTGNLDSRIANIELPSNLEDAVEAQGSDLLLGFGEGLMAMDISSFPENTIDSLIEETEDLSLNPRTFYEAAIEELRRIKNNAEDLFNLGSSDYDSLFDRTLTLKSADPLKTITNEEYEILNGFNDAILGLNLILASERLFNSTYEQVISDMIDRFEGDLNLRTSKAVEEITIVSGTSLERLAQTYLGDSTRWGELAELNSLQSPYVVDDFSSTLEGVLRPGDKLLIPSDLEHGFSQAPQTKEIKTTKGLSDLEKSLGTDLLLSKDYDLVLSNAGDLEVVSGATNMAQQVLLKLAFEKGEVMRHPQLGANIQVGKKFPPLYQIKDGIVDTLLQDSRIDQILDLSLIRDNSDLAITFKLKLKKIDLPIPVKIRVV